MWQIVFCNSVNWFKFALEARKIVWLAGDCGLEISYGISNNFPIFRLNLVVNDHSMTHKFIGVGLTIHEQPLSCGVQKWTKKKQQRRRTCLLTKMKVRRICIVHCELDLVWVERAPVALTSRHNIHGLSLFGAHTFTHTPALHRSSYGQSILYHFFRLSIYWAQKNECTKPMLWVATFS